MNDLSTLVAAAALTGLVHTLLGPDHYLPFVAMSRARRWTVRKTLWITGICGMGHVLGSVALGFAGLAVGVAVFEVEALEAWRGDIAGWLLLGFGLAYTAWALRAALRRQPHEHVHHHPNGLVHVHAHRHLQQHAHVHAPRATVGVTPWVLFTIFVFGPCEPLIPLFMYPAATGSPWHVVLVTAAFAATTIATMLVVVAGAMAGVARLRFAPLQRFGHVAAGLVLVACGAALRLGL